SSSSNCRLRAEHDAGLAGNNGGPVAHHVGVKERWEIARHRRGLCEKIDLRRLGQLFVRYFFLFVLTLIRFLGFVLATGIFPYDRGKNPTVCLRDADLTSDKRQNEKCARSGLGFHGASLTRKSMWSDGITTFPHPSSRRLRKLKP